MIRYSLCAVLIAALAGLHVLAATVCAQAPLRVEGQSILDAATGEPIRGFYAMYQGVPNSPAAMAADLDAMQEQFGLKGFAIEIGWNQLEPTRGSFSFNAKYETLLDLAEQKGLHVNIFFTPHYTPAWVYNQGIDVRNKTPDGQNANGLWLNYAPSSPAALQWQGEFQKRAIEHYSTKPAVTSFHLTNELGYGQANWLDYSVHAEAAWHAWRAERHLAAATMPLPTESAARPEDWKQWQLFRQDQLNHYFNTTYQQATQGLAAGNERLVHHRHNFYVASDAFVRQQGLYLDPNLSAGDSMGGNVYGVNEVMAAMMQAWKKPIYLTETSHKGMSNTGSGSATSAGALNAMFISQFFKGAQNQTVFRFSADPHYPMRLDADTPHPSFARFKEMTEVLARIDETHLPAQREVGYLWPREFVAMRGDQYTHVQHLYNNVMRMGRRFGQSPLVVFPSFLDANQPSAPTLAGLKMMYALRHYGMDQEALDSDGLRDWVSTGGTLVLELDSAAQLPGWLSGVTMNSTRRTTFSTLADSPFGIQQTLGRGDNSAWTLGGLDDVWATWDGRTTQAAVGVKNFGAGQVVLVGSAVFGSTGGFDPYPGLNAWVFGEEHLREQFEYYRLGHNVLALPRSAGLGGTVALPKDWLGEENEFYLMHLTSGAFSAIDWSDVTATQYLFEVPGGHLLMGLSVPEPAGPALLVLAGAALYRRPRSARGAAGCRRQG